jgi:pimeloyl-ACP methyl ester carboxylesterase
MTRSRYLFHANRGSTTRLTTKLPTQLMVIFLLVALASCGASPDPTDGTTDDSSAGQATAKSPTVKGGSTETTDLYDVGGHKLYMSCTGQGPTTVVYVHGWVNDAGYVPHTSATAVRDLLTDDYRVCLYDRRNVGSSETVDAVQKPKHMVRDMHAVLNAGGAEPPYILLAASFGGLVAHAYMKEHPKDAVGMVLIDTMFPDELKLDRYLPRDARFKYFTKDDKCCTLERIAQYDLIRSVQPTIGKEPHIPVVYLASKQEPRNENNYESPEYDARILDAQAAYVDRFSPGILQWVDAPHFMEPIVPDVIADAVREVDQLASSD